MPSTFEVIAEPTRRRILDMLREDERSVGELVNQLALSQPSVSKHLRVLREARLVRSRIHAQRRLYRLDPAPLLELEAWLVPYRKLWSRALDALERHLDGSAEHRRAEAQALSAPPRPPGATAGSSSARRRAASGRAASRTAAARTAAARSSKRRSR